MSSFVSKLFYLYVLIWGITVCSAFAQPALNTEKLVSAFDWYKKAKPDGQLFVHTDKTLYGNNETIWFSGYLTKGNRDSLHSLLSVALIREDSHEVMLQSKYLMQNGLSFGNLDVPDSLLAGNYDLVAYTNVMDKAGKPTAIFTQQITVKSTTVDKFTANLELIDTLVTAGVIRARLTVQVKQPEKILKPLLSYSIGGGKMQAAPIRDNIYTFNIRQDELKQPSSILLVKVSYGKDTQYLSVPLPQIKKDGIKIKFYPEGGSLSSGIESVLGWETLALNNQPVAVQAVLYKNNTPSDTLTTDAYGMGKFKLKPEPGYKYELKLKTNAYQQHDTTYTLPQPLQNGIVLHLNQAVVNDTLRLNIYSATPRGVRLLIHNYREVYAVTPIQATPGGSRATIALNALPKGIATITVLDEMDRPLAERLFFAKHQQKVNVKINTDKPVYQSKGDATVKIKLTDENGNSVDGLFSAAVVQENRLETKKTQNIESYTYLDSELGNMGRPAPGGLDNSEYLENTLLVKGWRKYTWQELMNTTPVDTVAQLSEPQITGLVKIDDRPLKKPVNVVNYRNGQASIMTTDEHGAFNLTLADLLLPADKKLILSVSDKRNIAYFIQMHDPYLKINNEIARDLNVFNYSSLNTIQKSADQQLPGSDKNIFLNQVNITGNKTSTEFYSMNKPRGANPCGDYVTDFLLNLPEAYNNPRNKPAVPGEKYAVAYKIYPAGEVHSFTEHLEKGTKYGWEWGIYAGCTVANNTLFKEDGIYTSREFYGVKTDTESIAEPQFLSTLFWKPGVITNKLGEAEFSFHTGDIKDTFKIVVQGISTDNVFSGEQTFRVTQNK